MAGTFTKEQHQKTKEQLDQGSGRFFSARQGINRVRIFPPPDGYNDISAEGWSHRSDDGAGNFTVWPCPKKMDGEECKHCAYADHYRSAAKAGDKEAKKIVDSYGARRNVYMVLDDVKDQRPEGPKIWEMSKKRAKEIYAACYNDEGDFIDVSDPKRGYDIVFQRTGEKLETEYTGLKRADKSTPLRKMEWLEDYPDVRELAKTAAQSGTSSTTDEDDEPPAPKKGKAAVPTPTKGKLKPPEPEEAEEEAEETESDDEAAEAPAPAPAKPAKPAAAAKPKAPEPTADEDDGPPPCYGKEWVENDPICVDCPFQDQGPDGACRELVAGPKTEKPKFKGKPVATEAPAAPKKPGKK